jgi:hypothetical protein
MAPFVFDKLTTTFLQGARGEGTAGGQHRETRIKNKRKRKTRLFQAVQWNPVSKLGILPAVLHDSL